MLMILVMRVRIGLNWFVHDLHMSTLNTQLLIKLLKLFLISPCWMLSSCQIFQFLGASQILRNHHHCSMGHCHLLLLIIIIIIMIMITIIIVIIMLLTGAGVRRAEVVCANDSPSEPRLEMKFTFFTFFLGRSLCSRYWWSVSWNFE